MLFYKVYIKLTAKTEKGSSPGEISKKSKEFYRNHGNNNCVVLTDISYSKGIGILCVVIKSGVLDKSFIKKFLLHIKINAVISTTAQISHTKCRLFLNSAVQKGYCDDIII